MSFWGLYFLMVCSIYLRFRDRLLGILVVEHAVGRRDHVLGGHQSAATELRAARAHQSHHPGILVFLKTELVKISSFCY